MHKINVEKKTRVHIKEPAYVEQMFAHVKW